MKGLLLFASVAFCLVAGALCQDQCATTINGVEFPNLANLRNAVTDYSATDASNSNYVFNFCGPSIQYPNCAGVGSSENCQNPTGSPKSCGVSTTATRSAVVSKSTNSVTFTWIGGSPSGSCVNAYPAGNGQYSRVTNVTVVCAPSEPTTITGLVTELPPTPPSTSPTCVYIINAKSQYACPKSGGGNNNGGDKNKEGLSGGSIFLIIISCLAFVYVVGGAIFNWQKYDASGWELCPNREFWSEFGALIKGGAVFTWSKITGNAPSASYESVE